MSVVAADSIVSIVVAIRSVMDGDYLNALIYGAFAVVGIIGVCRWYKASYHVECVGNKGIARFAGGNGTEALQNSNPRIISSMSKEQLQANLPDGWSYTDYNGRVHIKDVNGNMRVRIDPPDKVTSYDHMHIYDELRNLLDIEGNIVDNNSPAGHIPWNQ